MPLNLSDPALLRHVTRLLTSFHHLLGRHLVPPEGGIETQVRRLEQAPFVVVSHGTEADPILNYGNHTARRLWEMDWDTLVRTPSRLTAEAPARDERARLLERVTRNGYVDDYSGVRISATGRRFRIERAIVWNVTDETGQYQGQAATFDRWTLV